MEIVIRSKNVELTTEMSFWLERRVTTALARHAGRIRLVALTLTDLNGPRGGVDIRCLLDARLIDDGPIVVDAIAETVPEAANQAVECLVRSVVETVQCRRDMHRRRERAQQGWQC